jgi:DNA repair photolyase
MRWSNLTVETEERKRLPGYRDEAIVRHFEAPGKVQTRFYEVRAKSILNRVPEASRMPFRWTVNPYRGCSHACSYCVSADTRVLMADGRHKAIADVDVGDRIYGTELRGNYRKYTVTTVLDKWTTAKPAFRLVLDDDTELIASSDHRFLSDRGWKHVVDTAAAGTRDHDCLTLSNTVLGTGAFAPQPVPTSDYRRGYLTGVVEGEGDFAVRRHGRRADPAAREQRPPLALTDLGALYRTRDYLVAEDMPADVRTFRRAGRGMHGAWERAIGSRLIADRIAQLVEWPLLPSLDWCRGFLAGMFDADGSRSAFALRITSSDPQLLAWVDACAKRLGFEVEGDRSNDSALACVRIRGGLAEHLRFFHTTDPASTGRRSIAGQIVTTSPSLRVRAIESLDQTLPLYDVTTGTGDFIANGVVSHNCFARPTHTYLDFDAGRDFEREIVVKVNAPELLRAELKRSSWKGEHVALGTNTDPYQWAEGRYKLMPGIWEALRDAANPCSVLTKSPLLLRDLALMTEIAERSEFTAALSVPTLDERAWRATEPHTPNPRARLEAVGELTRAGIRTGVLIAPLMPGINDAPEQLARILELASAAGAAYVTGIALHLRGEVKGLFFEWLRVHRPDLLERYRTLYGRGAYAPATERDRLAALVTGPDQPPGRRIRGRTIDPTPDPRQPERHVAQPTLF